MEGHGAGLARREREDRDRLHVALRRRADVHVPLPQPRARGRRDDARRQSRVNAVRLSSTAVHLQQARMKPKMVIDKTGDEEVAVVVAFLHPHLEWDIALDARLFQQIRLELVIQEWVFGPLVDQERWPTPALVFEERRRVIAAPSCAVASE